MVLPHKKYCSLENIFFPARKLPSIGPESHTYSFKVRILKCFSQVIWRPDLTWMDISIPLAVTIHTFLCRNSNVWLQCAFPYPEGALCNDVLLPFQNLRKSEFWNISGPKGFCINNIIYSYVEWNTVFWLLVTMHM